ncbi:MAG: glycosyltransferase family 2 protein [Planctomycetota bacterium]
MNLATAHSASTHGPPDSITLSVIAPCLNEAGNVDALADRTLRAFDELRTTAELVLVDDGSTDGTWERIVLRSRADARVRGVRHECNRGIEAAWKTGLAATAGELICLIDADLQNPPEDIPRLYRGYLQELPDIVQAVRRPKYSDWSRLLMSRGLNWLLNLAFGSSLGDAKSGFILTRRAVLTEILSHRRDYRYFQSFLGVAAHVRGYVVGEVESTFERRTAGQSFLGRFPLRTCARILREIVQFRTEAGQLATPIVSPPAWSASMLSGPSPSGG